MTRKKSATKFVSPPKGTAVIYARFSCSKQREASIEDQLRVCTEWCRSNGYLILKSYTDYAMSGRTDDRPQFQEMIRNAGESEVVVVYMMDRFSRDVYDAPIYKKQLRDKGVRVASATEAMPDGPESILIESIYEAIAAMESAQTARRTKRGMEGNAMKCLHNGVVTYGYDFAEDGTYVINDEQAAVVREVFRRRRSRESLNAIATDLAARGVTTTRGNPCREPMLTAMLKNEKYAGVYLWGDVRVEDGMPAIISRDDFDAVQSIRSKKKRDTEVWRDFAFSGKGVCLECGHNLVGISGRGRSNVKYDYYRCSKKCGCKSIRADTLEITVANAIRKLLGSHDTALEIARSVAETLGDGSSELLAKQAMKTANDAERGIANILRAVEGGMDYADVADRLKELKLTKARAEADAAAYSSRAELNVEDFALFLEKGIGLDDRALLDAFVWQVQLSSEKIVVVLNYDAQGDPSRVELYRELDNCIEETYARGARHSFLEPRGMQLKFFSGCILVVFSRL